MKNKFLLLASISAVILLNNPIRAMDTLDFDQEVGRVVQSKEPSSQTRGPTLEFWKNRGNIKQQNLRLDLAEKVFDLLDGNCTNAQDNEIYQEAIDEIFSQKEIDNPLVKKVACSRMRDTQKLPANVFMAAQKLVQSSWLTQYTMTDMEPVIDYMLTRTTNMSPLVAVSFAENLYFKLDIKDCTHINRRQKVIEIIASSAEENINEEITLDIFSHKHPETPDELNLARKLFKTLEIQKWISKKEWEKTKSTTLEPLALDLWEQREHFTDQALPTIAQKIFPFLNISKNPEVYKEVTEYLLAFPEMGSALRNLQQPK